MSEILVVYYSRTGSTRNAAEELAKYLECDLAEIISKKKFRGPLGWIAGGKLAMNEVSVDIIEPDKKPQDYKLVVVCSPVWASNITPPVRTYLYNNKDKFNKVSYLLTFKGGGHEKALEKMSAAGGSPVKSVHFSGFERKSDVWVEKLTAYANELQDLTAAP